MSSLSDKKTLICHSSTRHLIEKKILKSYLDEQIKFLLERIHTLYPELFTKDDFKKEWELYQKWKPKLSMSKPIINRTPSKTKNNQNNKSKGKKQTKKSIPDEQNRCIARVFDVNNIIYKYSDTSIKNINNKELNTSNKINLTNTEQLDIYGRRCYGKRINGGNYCFVHQRNNPHGDFNTPVAPYLKDHFIKMCHRFK
tara:strand:+ start:2080 stop:2673 length:594 start_codon:yes stop_codon:yes gene_type:complete